MNKSFPITLLCLTLFVQFCFGQPTPLSTMDDAHTFEIRINAWMEPYRNEKAGEFDEWISMAMERDPTSAWQHPIASQIQEFVAEHQDEYIRLRKADLTRYPGLGNYLSGYQPYPDFQNDMRKELQGGSALAADELNRLQDLTNHRALHVSSLKIITSLIKGAVFDHLSEHRETTIADYSLNSMFGDKIFVDDMEGDQYRITFLNRLYALQYDWDIRTNRITIPDLYIYVEVEPAKGWLADAKPTANNTRQLIETELESLIWAMYDEMEQDSDRNEVMDKLEFYLESFYRDNDSLYVDTRQALLSSYPAALPEQWAEYEHDTGEAEEAVLAELLPMADNGGRSLPLYASVYDLDATGTALTIESATIWEVRKRYTSDVKQWLLGLEIYTREVEENHWEIHYFFDNFASKYTWNIATDEISGLIIKSK